MKGQAPIFFIHRNNSFYLKYVLNQARYFNESCPIKMISDDPLIRFKTIENIELQQVNNGALEFRKSYKHLSPLPYEFEYFCIARWLILAEYVKEHGNEISDLFYIDSDVLLFTDLNVAKSRFSGYDVTISNKIGPQYTWFSSKDILFEFAAFIEDYYLDPLKLKELHSLFEQRKNSKMPDGISDMTLLGLFIKTHNLTAFDFADHSDILYFDNNINSSDGFLMSGDIKKIEIKHKLAYTTTTGYDLVSVGALHFQGRAKYRLHRFYVASPYYFFDRIFREVYFRLKTLFGIHSRKKIASFIVAIWSRSD